MIGIKAVISWGGFLGMKQSDVKAVLKDSFTARGEYWHKQLRPHHFKRTAISRYGYTERSRSYTFRKKKVFGHDRPLVLSGRSEQLSANRTIQATFKSVHVRMPVRAFNFRPKSRGKKTPDMLSEFRAITSDEFKDMNDRQQAFIEKRLQSFAGRQTVTT